MSPLVATITNHIVRIVIIKRTRWDYGREHEGQDAPAEADVIHLLEKVGFAAIDLGGLEVGGRLQQFPGGPLPTLNLIKLP